MEAGAGLEMLPLGGMAEGASEEEREGKPGSPA